MELVDGLQHPRYCALPGILLKYFRTVMHPEGLSTRYLSTALCVLYVVAMQYECTQTACAYASSVPHTLHAIRSAWMSIRCVSTAAMGTTDLQSLYVSSVPAHMLCEYHRVASA
eukprot:2005886-Rhodomonas_salina.3